jgi:putative transposase
MLHELLRGERMVKNRKHTYHVYTEEGLQVPTTKRKKLTRPRQPMEVPTAMNQHWLMDFVFDKLNNAKLFRVLNVIDDYWREMVRKLLSVSINQRPTNHQISKFTD